MFFTKYHQETYWLTINGNNGFVGKIFEDTFIYNILSNFEKVSYFSLILFIFIIFLLSTNFKVVYFNYLLKTIIKKKETFKDTDLFAKDNLENNNESAEKNDLRIQENFSFERKNNSDAYSKINIKLPLLDFLKKPNKKNKTYDENKVDSKTLEKILLDFGVEGKIKKISSGPVVSLNEFEPAPGVKV